MLFIGKAMNTLLTSCTWFRFRLHPSLDLANVAQKCPFNYTGADFYALCSDAMLKAMSRTADGIENRVGMSRINLQCLQHDPLSVSLLFAIKG